MFGSGGSSFGSSTFGGFNQTPAQPAQSGGLFGNKPAFGATANTFGATPAGTFGATAGTTGGLFGAKPAAASTSLFGAPAATNTFGNTSAFGQSAPAANTSFGGSSLFGGTAASSSGGLFGGTTSTGSMFGGTTSTFGSTGATTSLFGGTTGTFGAATQQQGTNIKYACLQSTDTISNKGQTKTIQTQLHSISCMREYEGKCSEELRVEDYSLGRKGPQAGAAPLAAAAPASTGGLFGGTPAATPSAFGFGQTSTASTGGLFGGTAGFGAAAAKPTGGLFGTTAAAPASGGLFGTPAASTGNLFGGSSFGGAATTSSFGQPSGGLFGGAAAKPTTGLFGATTAPAASGGLFGTTTPAFGTTPAPAASTGLFGATQPSTGLFGGTAAPATGGLFGSTAAKPSFGGFGQAATATPAFGSTGTSLFGGTAAAKPTFSLGGTTGSTGLFGGTASTGFGGAATTDVFGRRGSGNPFSKHNALGPGLFGNTCSSSLLFGNTTTPTTFGTSLFGGTAAAKPSLFGNTTLGGTTSGGLFGGGGSMFGGTAAATLGSAQQPVLGASLDSSHIHSVVAALSATPFGDSPLFRTAKDDYKKLNPASPATASTGNNKSRITAKPSRVRPKPLSNGYNQLFEGLEDDISPSPEAFLPRNSLKKLVLQSARYHDDVPDILDIPSKCEESEDITVEEEEQLPIVQTVSRSSDITETLDTTEPDNRSITPIRMSPMRKIPFNINESSIREAPPLEAEEDLMEPENVTICKTEQLEEAEEEIEEPVLGLDGKPLKAPPPTLPFTLERPEYYTVPGPDELLDMIRDESLVVRDLIVGRTGYGEVKFLGELDLWGLDLDSTIHFRRKEITVYPDDSVKPPQGQGLNRKSEVTLEAVYPLSKGTRENITDPAQIIKMGYPAKIEKITFKMGAKFMEYQPENGRWTFMVKHFSQYGLLDSDEEEEENVKRIKEEEPLSPGDVKGNILEDSNILSYNDQYDGTMCDSDDDNNSPSKFLPREMPEEYKGYKAGLFGMGDSDVEEEEEDEEEEKFVQGNQFNFSSTSFSAKKGPILKTALKMEKLDVSNLNMSSIAEKTTEAPSENKCSVVPSLLVLPPHSQSVAKARGGVSMDEGLVRGHSFRVGWTPDGTVITRQNAHRRKTKVLESHSTDSLCLEGFAVSCGTEVNHHVELLEVQLEHTTFQNRNGVIEAVPNEGPDCLEALICKLGEKEDKSVLKSALHLVNALWGRGQDKPGPYAHQMFRRASLSAWLSSQLRVVAEKKTLEYAKLQSCHLPAVLAWLCGGGIKEAAEILCKAGDYQLALLVSQSSTPIIRQLLLKQLHEWRDTGYDAMISSDRLKVYVLLSGEQQWESSTKTINICEGLDWLSSFALYLQYLPPSAPLEEAVCSFQESYTSGVALGPVVQSGKVSVFWQLILLYCNHAHPLAEVFNIQGITSNVLDMREVWHLWHVLISLGLPLPPHALSTQLILASAGQLERLGLWEWSLFLLQHLPVASGRVLSTKHLVYRTVQGHSCRAKEEFCNTRLYVPLNMFDLARAQLSLYKHQWSEAVLSFILAGDSNSAHDIFMDKIASSSILKRDEAALVPLLEPLHNHCNDISEWSSKGGVYYAYLSLPTTLPLSEEDLEDLRSKVSSLGHALNALPYTTVTEQCAVTMMGLRVANMLLEIWKRLFGEQEKRELLLTLSSFPLPVDYEINDVITKLSGQIMGEENFEMVA